MPDDTTMHYVDPTLEDGHGAAWGGFFMILAYARPVCETSGPLERMRRTLIPEYVTCEACRALLPSLGVRL